MNIRLKLLVPIVCAFFVINLNAQIPFIYEVENSGANYAKPQLPDNVSLLKNYPMLPDPFAWFDGSGRSTAFSDWEHRRNEIKASIEKYEIGVKPDRPDTITATLSNDTLQVVVTKNGKTLILTSKVIIPEGPGPFPIVIGMNSGSGSIPSSLFEGVIKIPFNHDQVVSYSMTNSRNLNDPYYKLYPNLTYVGDYSAWSWGISRLIDGIEMVKSQLNADTKHIAVTGCSYAGKMALFGGALDERVALTIAQESGGGGTTSWRVAETIGSVEKIDNTSYSWFMESMKSNFKGKVGILPHDHHELMAMVAPRALLVLGNPDYKWLGDPAGYVDCKATEVVYNTFGISDRFGYSIRGGHSHCDLPKDSYPEVEAFINKFLLAKDTANTDIHVCQLNDSILNVVDYNKWIKAWADPINPNVPSITIDTLANSTFISPATVTLTTAVTDPNNDVAKVIFYNNDQIVGQDSIAPYSLTLTDLQPGTYNICAKAIDEENLISYSNIVTVVVTTPPTVAYKTSIAPTIDGIIDDIWTNPKVMSLQALNKLIGTNFTTTNLSGAAKMLWDNDNVYLLAVVNDSVKINDSQANYQDDGVEFYFDGNNAKATSYDADDVQLTFDWNDGTTIGVSPSSMSSTDIIYKIVDTDSGYIFEAKIPWKNLKVTPTDGKNIGFDFMINDDDNGGDRENKLSWNATKDNAWSDASYFGTVLLKDEVLTSINDPKNMGSVSIYPNPAKNVLLVKGTAEEFEYKIVDTAGKLLLSGRSQSNIPIEKLSQGLYLLNIIDGTQVTKFKFVKD